MNKAGKICIVASVALVCLSVTAVSHAQQASMTFFITSAGPGKGGDLGGIEGADRHCQSLAQAAGAGSRTWRAYLSTQGAGGTPAINARDRIGRGPWQNAKGEAIAQSVDDLHSANNKISKQTALNEKGEPVNGRGDTPNRHDILTGSQPDGRAFAAGEDRTCGNWTKSTQGAAMVGHMTAWACATTNRRSRGTRRIPRAGRTAAAARPICAAPAAMACSTASRRTRRSLRLARPAPFAQRMAAARAAASSEARS